MTPDMPKLLMAESTYLDSPLKVGCHHYSRLLSEAGDIGVFYLSTPISPLHFLKRSNVEQTKRRAAVWRAAAWLGPSQEPRPPVAPRTPKAVGGFPKCNHNVQSVGRTGVSAGTRLRPGRGSARGEAQRS